MVLWDFVGHCLEALYAMVSGIFMGPNWACFLEFGIPTGLYSWQYLDIHMDPNAYQIAYKLLLKTLKESSQLGDPKLLWKMVKQSRQLGAPELGCLGLSPGKLKLCSPGECMM